MMWAFYDTGQAGGTGVKSGNWHPLTWLSHMADWELFGDRPGLHHLSSLLIHITNSLLIFFVFKRMTRKMWQSAFVAGAFALHPLHVESVAWISERKDILSTLFLILTIYAYIYYTEHKSPRRYLLVLLMFSLGLLAKPMLVTLPCILLLLDYWPLNRLRLPWGREESPSSDRDILAQSQQSSNQQQNISIWKLIWEKIPLLILSFGSIFMTFYAQRGASAVQSFDAFSVKVRIFNTLFSYVRYIGKMFWPNRLSAFYPHPGDSIPLWQVAGTALVLVGITIFVIWQVRRRRWLAVGWFWYLGTLVPVIGIIQVGVQAIADRYTYIPLIGLFIMIAWGTGSLVARWRFKTLIVATMAVVVFLAMMLCTRQQAGYWQNTSKLFNHALAVTDNNFMAQAAMGEVYLKQKKYDKAIYYFTESAKSDVYRPGLHGKLGFALLRTGKTRQAVDHLRKELNNKTNPHIWRTRLAAALTKLGQLDEAVEHYRKALELKGDNANTHAGLGNLLLKMNKTDQAIKSLSEAVRLNPDNMSYRQKLNQALSRQKKYRR